jgi:uncharacterized protein
MDITPLISPDQQVIQSYSKDRFRVNGELRNGAVIVFTNETMKWNCSEVAKLTIGDFSEVVDRQKEIDVVLLGCGRTVDGFDRSLLPLLKDDGLVVEVMDTGAACRTYNALMAEGRRVVAMLLPV